MDGSSQSVVGGHDSVQPSESRADRRPVGVTVVIPVRGRAAMLRSTLSALERARRHVAAPVEVLVVDDSDPAGRQANERSCEDFGARLVDGPRSVAAKRNLGVRLSRYELLLFIDSDCIPDTNLLSQHLDAMGKAPAEVAAIAGHTEVPKIGDGPLRLRLLRQNFDNLNAAFDWSLNHERLGWATTSNLLVRRAAFVEVGGFDETVLTVVGGEDVDFGLRLNKSGYDVGCNPDAVVRHDSRSQDTVRATFRRLFTYGRCAAWLCVQHPERTSRMLNPVAAIAVAAAVAMAVPPRVRRRAAGGAALLAGLLFLKDARFRFAGADPRNPLLESVAGTLADWSHNAGYLVGAIQLGRPAEAFQWFAWWDDRSFVSRSEASGSDPEDE
jgi:hypothetical protein